MLFKNSSNRKYAIVFLIAVLVWLDTSSQTVLDWKDQVAQTVAEGETPSDPSAYQWTECLSQKQGIRININSTETKKIFVEQGNCVFSFADFRHAGEGGYFINCMFTSIKISINPKNS